jgi:hypothetical protein
VGAGIGMALVLSAENEALVFRSDHFFLEIGRFRLKCPRLLAPGCMEIVHRDKGRGYFTFSLILTHRWAGLLFFQEALFRDPGDRAPWRGVRAPVMA